MARVEIYVKSTCGFCFRAKRLFDEAYRADGNQGEWQWGTQEGARWAGRKHVEAYQWMRDRLRSIGVRALLTDNNGWYNQQVLALNRKQLDFVDDHFYWDHPRFLGNSWGLPSQGWQMGRSAIPEEGGGLRTMGLSRYAGKPFVCIDNSVEETIVVANVPVRPRASR